jgi:hypothetical protein
MRRFQASEVRRCDITTRFPEPNGTDRSVWDRDFYTQMGDDVSFRRSMQSFREGLIGKPHHWDASGRTICQAKRRRRSSNKIKKVK